MQNLQGELIGNDIEVGQLTENTDNVQYEYVDKDVEASEISDYWSYKTTCLVTLV